jgi:hypothetical protein
MYSLPLEINICTGRQTAVGTTKDLHADAHILQPAAKILRLHQRLIPFYWYVSRKNHAGMLMCYSI